MKDERKYKYNWSVHDSTANNEFASTSTHYL